MSRSISFVFALVLATCVFVFPAMAQEDDSKSRTVEILEGYTSLLSSPLDEDVTDHPFQSWSLAAQAINAGALRFTVDPTQENIIPGVRFLYSSGAESAHIVFSQGLVDSWVVRPSLTYTLIGGAVKEAEMFFRDPQAWARAKRTSLGRFLIQSEIYMAQAQVVRDRLLPSGYLLSPYESYLLDSFEKDSLGSFLLYVEGYSLPVAQSLLQIQNGYEEEADDEQARETVVAIGQKLLESREDLSVTAEDAEIYPIAVAIHSWLEFSPEVISRIHNKDRKENPLTFDVVLSLEEEYDQLRKKLDAKRISDTPMMQHILQNSQNGFQRF
ncbi:MAG: hypothetical protein MI717_05785 [Spirochaetales bacterium]|nr:hypothetical protein [Spirochaetales bacterium]